MFVIRGFVFSFVVLFLASCGDGDSGFPSERSATTIDGFAVDALVRNGTISIYDFSSGSEGELLGTATTGSDGYYELPIRSSSRPVLIELTGGSYIEERSGRTVNLTASHAMRALTHYQEGTPLSVMVTPFTTLAAGLAEYKIENGENVQNSITAAYTAIASIYGIDILNTYPVNITDPANLTLRLDDGYLYGFLVAAISSWTYDVGIANGDQPHNIYRSIDLVSLMYEDIRTDGFLDGTKVVEGIATPLTMGTVILDANVYRNGFATHLLTLSERADINKTGLGISHLLNYATVVAASGHEVFASVLPIPIDSDGPTISPDEAEGTLYNATAYYSVTVNDFVGVQSVEFFIDSVSIGMASDSANPSVLVNTTLYSDGDHMLGVRAVDELGNETYQEFLVKFNNTGPVMVVMSKRHTNQTEYDINGTWAVNAGTLPAISVSDYLGTRSATVNNDGSWAATVYLQSGNNTVGFEITDSLTNKTSVSEIFALDMIPPVYTVSAGSTRYEVSGSVFIELLSFLDVYRVIYQTTDKVALNGLPFDNTAILSTELIPAWSITATDPYVDGVRTEREDIIGELLYMKGGVIQKDWTPLTASLNRYVVSLTEESLTPDWHQTKVGEEHRIHIRLTDRAGNSTVIEIVFEVAIYPVTPTVSVDINDFTSSVAWENRAMLHNANLGVMSYSWINDTGYEYYVAVRDTGNHRVTNTVETAIREHLIRPVEVEERRILGATFPFFNWTKVDYGGYYIDLTNRTFYNYNESGWEPVLPALKTYGAYASSVSDALPEQQATSWEYWHVDNTFKPPTPPSGGIIPGTGVPFSLDYQTCLNNCPPQSLTAYGYVDGEGGRGNTLQRRTVDSYESMPGHPYSIIDSFVEQNYIASDFIAYIDGVSQPEVNGYFRVPAGSEVSIHKIMNTPNMTVYDDVEVGFLDTFNSYSLKQYDRFISWSIDKGVDISIAHAESQLVARDVPNLQLVISSGQLDMTISR